MSFQARPIHLSRDGTIARQIDDGDWLYEFAGWEGDAHDFVHRLSKTPNEVYRLPLSARMVTGISESHDKRQLRPCPCETWSGWF